MKTILWSSPGFLQALLSIWIEINVSTLISVIHLSTEQPMNWLFILQVFKIQALAFTNKDIIANQTILYSQKKKATQNPKEPTPKADSFGCTHNFHYLILFPSSRNCYPPCYLSPKQSHQSTPWPARPAGAKPRAGAKAGLAMVNTGKASSFEERYFQIWLDWDAFEWQKRLKQNQNHMTVLRGNSRGGLWRNSCLIYKRELIAQAGCWLWPNQHFKHWREWGREDRATHIWFL